MVKGVLKCLGCQMCVSCASTTYVEHFPLRLSAVCELHPELIQAHTPSMSSNMSSGSSKNSGRGACDYDFKMLPGLIRRPHPAHWHHKPGIYHQNTIGNHYKLPSYARAQSSYKLIQTHGAGNWSARYSKELSVRNRTL